MNSGSNSNISNIYTETPAKPGFHSAAGNTAYNTYAKMAKSVVIGTIFSLFSSVLLLVVFAFIINAAFGDPDKVLNIFTGIIASLGALIGGFRASKINGANGFVTGLLTGIATSIVIFVIMLFGGKHSGETASAAFRIVMIACQLIFAGIGGIFAVNSHGSKSRSYSPASRTSKTARTNKK